MIERFSVRIATPTEREKALSQIFRAVLQEPIAIITSIPRGRDPKGRINTVSRSVIVLPLTDELYHDIVELEPNRLVGVYRHEGNHRATLSALTEDLEATVNGATDC